MTESRKLYASIALPVPVNSPFTYVIPEKLIPSADFGFRALVPFGKRMLTGFIIGLRDEPGDVPVSKLKPIVDVIDDEPVFDAHMYSLAEWVADYYLSSVGEVLKAAMPFGTMIRSRVRVHPAESAGEGEDGLTSRQKEVLDIVRARGGILLRSLEREAGFPVSGVIRTLERRGLIRLESEVRRPEVKPRTVRFVVPRPAPAGTVSPRAREQVRCVEVLKRYGDGIALSEFLERHGFSRGVVNSVVQAGAAYYEEREASRITGMLEQESIDVDHPLTAEQEACFRAVMNEAGSGTPRPVLVRGVTGSGKTRLYIELVREMLKRGKGALILVPEISLTPQTTRFFSSVFPGRIAVMHSAMSPGERFDMWRLVHDGSRDVVIGPRSAVFAPLKSPGVIIVDEEHDASYKQDDPAPRYHARDVAVVRGRLLGIPVVLGSATPSLESWHNARRGKYLLCTLAKRVKSRPMPEVRLVDMRRERAEGNLSSISRVLREELGKRVERGEKSIVLINRRGFATGIQCRSCGEMLKCQDCTVTLTYHSSKRLALCHVCGYRQIVTEHCPSCGSTDIRYRGAGTQRIEKELAAIVGPESIVRMDSDTTGVHDAHFRLLEEFRTGDAAVLLGTQMVAKGLDFPEVTLVGVVSADSSLSIPDFRAGERTFQLLTQVAGRAGRGNVPGTVVLQTYNPDNYAITAAVAQDYEAFTARETKLREEVDFPPFTRLVLLEVSSPDAKKNQRYSESLASYLSEHAPEGTEILGPVDAPLARIRGRHRIHILLKSRKITRILRVVRYAVEKHRPGAVTLTVDVDPVDVM